VADGRKNLAFTTVVTPPSPGASGTSVVVADGTVLPATPFNATVWASGTIPTPSNAEIVRVTLNSGGTLTITRTMESTTARNIQVGDYFAATVTLKTLTDIEALITAEAVARAAADAGLVPTTRLVNGHALNADVTVTKSDLGLGSVPNIDTSADYRPGGTDVAVTDGGTGASDAATARTNLGVGTAGTLASDTDGTLAANSDSKVATQKATKTYVDTAVTGLLDFKGATDASANPNYPAANKGDAYVVSVAGKIGGASGKSVDVADVYLATADNAGGTEASVGTSWTVLEHNLIGALLAANNLSDIASALTARVNLGAAQVLVPTAVKTALYTAVSGDFVPVDTTGGGVTVNLPNAPADRATVAVALVKQTGTNAVTVACQGSDVLDVAAGSTSATIGLLFQTEVFQYKASGAIWYRVSNRFPRTQLYAAFTGDVLVDSAGVMTLQASANTEAIIRANSLDQMTPPAANLNINAKRLTAVADASAATDALNRQSADARFIALGAGVTINRQVFAASGTYNLPAGAVGFVVGRVVGPGGGGGAGRRGAAGSARGGGGGGAAGGVTDFCIRVADIGTPGSATVAVTIGTGGTGGAAQTADSNNGANGTSGSGTSSFGAFAAASNGGLGSGGSTTGGGGGTGAFVTVRPAQLFVGTLLQAAPGSAGGASAAAGANGGAGSTGGGPGGGAGGGGADVSNNRGDGGLGGANSANVSATAGTGVGGNGASATVSADHINGGGGGGGACGSSAASGTVGGTGGNGVRGGGGGGGGASTNGSNSGAGGNGGDGYCVVYTYVTG
jgi:hypothetical protein